MADVTHKYTLAPDWHPLAHIDQFILACGWKATPQGFIAPEAWEEAIQRRHGGGRYWSRENAARFCIAYYEEVGIPF